jgi:2-dehydro-3-deoxyphosphogalactonate aldolase
MFPAEQMSPAVLKAWSAVLPPGTGVIPVGGVTPQTAADWLAAGAAGVALGSAIFSPSRRPSLVTDALIGCSRLLAVAKEVAR